MYKWTSLERERFLHNDPPILYWNDHRNATKCRYIPSYYNQKLLDKLQQLHRKNMSGLNLKIKDRIKLFPYRDLNDLVQICIKVEQKHLRKGSSQKES